jgi:hypothetical protein
LINISGGHNDRKNVAFEELEVEGPNGRRKLKAVEDLAVCFSRFSDFF